MTQGFCSRDKQQTMQCVCQLLNMNNKYYALKILMGLFLAASRVSKNIKVQHHHSSHLFYDWVSQVHGEWLCKDVSASHNAIRKSTHLQSPQVV